MIKEGLSGYVNVNVAMKLLLEECIYDMDIQKVVAVIRKNRLLKLVKNNGLVKLLVILQYWKNHYRALN